MIRREYRSYFIGGLIFICLIVLTFRLVFHGFKGAGTLYIPELFTLRNLSLFAGILILFYLFDSLRLYFVFMTIGKRIPFKLIIKLVFINIFASGVTPLATGGGFAQIYFLTRHDVPLGTATAATTIRTAIASAAIFAAVPVILVLEKGLKAVIPVKHGVIYSLILILIYGTALFILVRKKERIKSIAAAIVRLLCQIRILKYQQSSSVTKSIIEGIDLFIVSLNQFIQGRKIFLLLALFSAAVYLFLLFLFPYVLIHAVHAEIHIITALSIQVLITFLIYFTPTPGGSGVAEGGFALIFSHFLSPGLVPPLTFYWRFLTAYLGMIIGLFIFYREVWRKERE